VKEKTRENSRNSRLNFVQKANQSRLNRISKHSLRHSIYFSQSVKENLFSFIVDKPQSQTSDWQTWLNMRLPNPEQQIELKEALEQTYPRSKLRTIWEVVILGSGAWLVSTSIGSIIDWVVQKWLDTITLFK